MFTASVPIYHTGNRTKIKHVSVILTFSCSAGFEDFAQKKNRSHVALCERNSGTESGRGLFKGSKDSASLLVCTQNIFFCLGVRIFF